MADLFAIVGIVTVTLVGLGRWWEERQVRHRALHHAAGHAAAGPGEDS